MKARAPAQTQIPLDIVGSTAFGRYPKISLEQTFNMIMSDGWMVPSAGYKKIAQIDDEGEGRGIYSSSRFNHLIAAINDGIYTLSPSNSLSRVATIDTSAGDIFMDGNNADEIAICDRDSIYIYNFRTNTFGRASTSPSTSLDFIPGYVAFQSGYFVAPATGRAAWRLSTVNDGLAWPDDAGNEGELQTKPDDVMAVIRFPGKGNLILVFGKTVTEFWYNTGTQLFPFTKNTFNDIDFGCANAATIATNDTMVFWVGTNEKSGPVIMYTDGSAAHQISNDGINFRLANLVNPTNCYGFCFKQDGHQFYQVTWPDDALSLAFDCETKKFFTMTDRFLGAHIAKRVAFFNNSYYFVSFIDGNIYEMNSKYPDYDGEEIPRIRVCKHVRAPGDAQFIVNNITFTLEQGDAAEIQRVDFSCSKDGGASFGNVIGNVLNPIGKRRNRLNFWRLGMANDFVPQFRFWGHSRFVATDGFTSIYQ